MGQREGQKKRATNDSTVDATKEMTEQREKYPLGRRARCYWRNEDRQTDRRGLALPTLTVPVPVHTRAQ